MSKPAANTKQTNCNGFKKIRLKANFSQEALARAIDVSVSTIRRWEKGQCEPTMTVAQMTRFCIATKNNFYKLPGSLL